ncbi:MAG: type IX secretion system membrane protein PorP/SprF [Bacteroidota bacterium]
MKRLLLVIALILSFASLTKAQDPQFSQFYAAPLYLNPGFAGTIPGQRLVANTRIQWPNLPQAFVTHAVSYDLFLPEVKSGFGIQFTTDKMGSGGFRTTTAALLYSYKLKISDKWLISPGIYFGYGSFGIDRDNLTLGDGLQFGVASVDPRLFQVTNDGYFDFGSGLLAYNKNIWVGISAYHINEPNRSILGSTSNESPVDMKVNIHAGFKIPLYNGPRNLAKVDYITPSFVYRIQGPFQQFDIGVHYHVDPVVIGFWYRGIPVMQNFSGNPSQDAVIFYLGLLLKNFEFGYSYDFTVSNLGTAAGGSHEASLVYTFQLNVGRGGVKKKYKLIPCPTFNSKAGFWN